MLACAGDIHVWKLGWRASVLRLGARFKGQAILTDVVQSLAIWKTQSERTANAVAERGTTHDLDSSMLLRGEARSRLNRCWLLRVLHKFFHPELNVVANWKLLAVCIHLSCFYSFSLKYLILQSACTNQTSLYSVINQDQRARKMKGQSAYYFPAFVLLAFCFWSVTDYNY